ncbi:MAG: hypothetical protein GXY02_08215, partial [Actinobacteria bacterium]|nr:hypothetical protein [Actinomycetota bacterium]
MSCQIRRRRSVDAIVTGLTTALFVVAALISTLVGATPAAAAVDPSPPVSPTKLIFIHHSTGELWLADDHGGLGLELRRNDYFVSDTNYGWGRSLPPSRGEDIG